MWDHAVSLIGNGSIWSWNWIERIADLGILVALFTWWRNTKLNREAAALAAYRKYLELCISRPRLATYDALASKFEGLDFRAIRKTGDEDAAAYEWFLSYLLNTCEEILENVSAKGEWKRALRNQLVYHEEALKLVWPKWKATYGAEMDALVSSVISSSQQSTDRVEQTNHGTSDGSEPMP